VLRETVRLAQGAGLVRLGLVAIDGTKVRANTSRSTALSHQRMVEREARLEAEIATVLQRLDEVNAAEDAAHDEEDDGSGGLPAERHDRPRRVAKLQAVRAQLEQEKAAALKPTPQQSLADPEANMMRVGNDGALTYAGAGSSAGGRRCGASGTWSPRRATCAASSRSGSRRHDAIARRAPLPSLQSRARTSCAAPAWLAAASRSRVPRTPHTRVPPRAKT